MRKHKLKLKARIEYDLEIQKARAASLELIDLLLEIIENEREALLAEIEAERKTERAHLEFMINTPNDLCDVCHKPWSDHDFGVPAPLCP
jgi:hypothetical protein